MRSSSTAVLLAVAIFCMVFVADAKLDHGMLIEKAKKLATSKYPTAKVTFRGIGESNPSAPKVRIELDVDKQVCSITYAEDENGNPRVFEEFKCK